MAFKMKGWSGNHGSPAKNYKKGYYGDSPAKKTYKEAYKSRDMKTYGSMSESEYIAEAKRQNKSYKETGKWDAPKKVSKPGVASKPMSVKAPEKAAVKPTKIEATGKIKRQDKRRAKKKAIASQAGTSKLEKRLNYAGAKARARKAARQEKKKNNK